MAEDVVKSVRILFESVGEGDVQKNLARIEEQINSLYRAKKLTKAEADSLSKELVTLGRNAQRAADGSRQLNQGLTGTATAAGNAANSASGLNSSAQAMATGSLPRLRYALYDVSTTLAIAGAGMVALSTATVGTAIAMDRQFADVVRTTGVYTDQTGQQVSSLRNEFNQLFASLPASWSDLTDIGTLAGQLGVASENVAEFTSLVAKFATVSDVSVEQSATAFGRLSELLDVPASQFENLGSSILAVGVDSVATEGQIINTATQLASMGNFAGFSADEVFGLSAALASLGTQPELSRGVITRLFTNISEAISEGGDRLDRFGSLAGVTGKQFATAWGSDAAGALTDLLSGLGKVEESESVAVLKELGITASRDIPTILRLAQNSDLLARSLQVAATGYSEGSALQEQYGVIAETVSAKLTVLRNNFQALVSNVGGAGNALGPVIDLLNGMIRALNTVASNPVGNLFLTFTVSAIAVAGVLSLMAGGAARVAGSMAAMMGVMNDLGGTTAKSALTFGAFTKQLSLMGPAGAAAAAGIRGVKVALVSTGIGLALVAAGEALAFFYEKATGQGVNLDTSGLSDAIRKDTEAAKEGASSFAVLRGEVDSASSSASSAGRGYSTLDTYLGDVNSTLSEQNYLLGENSKMWLANQIQTSESYQEFANLLANGDVASAFTNIGLNFSQVLEDTLTGNPPDLTEYKTNLETQLGNVLTTIANLEGAVSLGTDSAAAAQLATAERSRDTIQGYISALDAAIPILGQFETASQDAVNKIAADDFLYGALGIERVADSAELAAAGLDDVDSAGGNAASTLYDVVNAALDASSSMLGTIDATYNLGGALAENGASFDAFSVGGRANIAALQQAVSSAAAAAGDDTALFGSLVRQIISQLVAAGAVGAEQVSFISSILANQKFAPTSSSDLAATALLTGQVSSGFASAAKSAGSMAKSASAARKEVRTLSDYVSDLQKVFADAFEFRFGFGQSQDETADAIQSILDGFADAQQKVRDTRLEIQGLQADISGLRADQGTLNYQLGVAIEYGDTLRAAQIRAELEKVSADLASKESDLADTQNELTKAQQESTPTLEGNTEAARNQRAAVLDLLQSYQDQVAAYANTGASQEQVRQYAERLRGEFERQLVQLGYNDAQVKKYSASFDDMVTVINKLPRNLTMSANVDPALRALDEYNAALNKTRDNASAGGFSPSVSAASLSEMEKAARGMALYNSIVSLQHQISGLAPGSSYRKSLEDRLKVYTNNLNTGNYYDGGYTGPGGMYEPAGTVHRGEYVIPKRDVNQRTGLPYADALDRLRRGTPGRVGYAQGGYVQPSQMIVELGPKSLRAVQEGGQVILQVDGRTLASTVNKTNASVTGTMGLG